jgi:hypothetical protein
VATLLGGVGGRDSLVTLLGGIGGRDSLVALIGASSGDLPAATSSVVTILLSSTNPSNPYWGGHMITI